jgi:hypothetical protein
MSHAYHPRAPGQASRAAVRRLQSGRAAGLLRRFLRRETIDGWIDLFRLRLDTFPQGRYQPVPSLPGRVVKRAEGSISRWSAMAPLVRELGVRTAVDIGANEGYFSIQLGHSGIKTVALESAPNTQRTALLAVRRAGLENVGVLAMEAREDTVKMIPPADCAVILSVWHHMVRDHGLEAATAVVSAVWAGTARVLFFDTGEDEMPDEYGLPPMGPDPRTWIEGYLASACPGGEVRHLGTHAAFDAAGDPCRRNLFAVVRR